MDRFPPRAGTTAARARFQACRLPDTLGADLAEAPAVEGVGIPEVGPRRAWERRIRAGEVVARPMRRAAQRARGPAVTTNVHLLACGLGVVVAAQGAAKLDRTKTELVAKLVGGSREPFEF